MKRKMFHDTCWLAVRCHRPLCTLSGCNSDHDTIHSADSWREQVRPLVATDGSRYPLARRALRQRVVEDEHVTEEGRQRDKFIMNKKRFKVFRKKWDDMDESEASSDFERVSKSQNWVYMENGVDQVAVSDVERITSCTKNIARKKVVQTQDIDPAPAQRHDNGGGDGGLPRPRARSPTQGTESGRSRSRRRRRRRRRGCDRASRDRQAASSSRRMRHTQPPSDALDPHGLPRSAAAPKAAGARPGPFEVASPPAPGVAQPHSRLPRCGTGSRQAPLTPQLGQLRGRRRCVRRRWRQHRRYADLSKLFGAGSRARGGGFCWLC